MTLELFNMLQLTFLGTSGSVPTTERAMPALSLKYNSTLMLWDCGEGTQRQMMRYKVGYGSVSQIYVTHPHLDHYLGIFGLLETLRLSSVSPSKLTIYSPKIFGDDLEERYNFINFKKMKKGVLHKEDDYTISAFPIKHCKSSYGLVFEEAAIRKFYEKKAHKLGLKGRLFKEIQKKGSVTVKGKKITLDSVTWLRPGRKIVYTGDGIPSDITIDVAKNADVLIHESTFDSSKESEALERFHSTTEQAAKIAKKAKVKRLLLTHISPRYSDTVLLLKQARKIFKNSEIAQDGMTIDVRFSE